MDTRDGRPPEPAPTDEDIVAGVLAGDRGRFDVLVERHGSALLGWFARRTAGGDEARDLYQETWLRAYQGLARLEQPSRLRAWLLGIAFHTLDKHRRAHRKAGFEPLGEREPVGAPEASMLERAEQGALIAAAVARLPARQREVFELRALVGLDHASIAARLDLREDNVRANYYQALRKLRAELGEQL